MASLRLAPGSTVLVTGATGLIGSATVQELLKLGYNVVGTSRDPSTQGALVEKFERGFGKDRFRLERVEDFTDAAQLRPLLKGVAGIVHLATDVSFGTSPEIVVDRSVAATLAMLSCAASEPSVKAVVMTSSDAAVNVVKTATTTTSDMSFNEDIVKRAWSDGKDDPIRAVTVYSASKVQSEQAAWRFVSSQPPHFSFNTVLPGATFGQVVNPTPGFYSTHSLANDLFTTGQTMLVGFTSSGTGFFVGLTDCALLHVAALLDPTVDRERLWAVAGGYSVNELLKIWRREFPGKVDHPDIPDAPGMREVKIENGRSLELLGRFGRTGWQSLEDAATSNVRQLVGQ